MAKGASLFLLIPGVFGFLAIWRSPQVGSQAKGWLRWLAFWVLVTAVLEGAGGLGLAELAIASRHLAVLYLHALLVGVVTSSLILVVRGRLGVLQKGLFLHHGGLACMLLGLALAGGTAIVPLPAFLPRLGMILGLAGGGAVALAALSFLFVVCRRFLLRGAPSSSLGMISEGEP